MIPECPLFKAILKTCVRGMNKWENLDHQTRMYQSEPINLCRVVYCYIIVEKSILRCFKII